MFPKSLLVTVLLSFFLLAESTIPDSKFKEGKLYDYGLSSLSNAMDFMWVGLGTAIGAGVLGSPTTPAFIVGGTLFGSAMSIGTRSILELGSKSDVVLDTINRKLNEIRFKVSSNPDYTIDPKQMRMEATSEILNILADKRIDEIKHQMPAVKEFLMQTQEVFKSQAKDSKEFAKTLEIVGKNVNSLQSTATKLTKDVNVLGKKWEAADRQIDKLAIELDDLNEDSQDIRSALHFMAKETASSFYQVSETIQKIKIKQDEATTLTRHLVESAVLVSTKGFESDKKIMGLEIELRNLKSKDDFTGSMAKVVELKKAILIEQERRIELEQTLSSIESGIGLIGLIATASGNPQLGRQINTIGHSAITIARSIGSIIIASGPLAFLGPIAAIGGAFFAIAQLFDSSPTMDEQIFKAVQQLAKSVEIMRVEMHKRFDVVEKLMFAHHNYTEARFNRIDERLYNMHVELNKLLSLTSKFYKNSIDHFLCLQGGTAEVKEIARSINTILNRYFDSLYTQDYKQLRYMALNHHRLHSSNLTTFQSEQYFGKFVHWTSEAVTDPLLTQKNAENTPLSVALSVRTYGIDANIRGLAMLAHTHFGLQAAETLPHPELWAEAVETFLEFLWRTPEFERDKKQLTGVKEIRKTGVNFQRFVDTIQSNSQKLFGKLKNFYIEKVRNVQNVIQTVVLDTIQRDGRSMSLEEVKNEVAATQVNNLKPYDELKRENYQKSIDAFAGIATRFGEILQKGYNDGSNVEKELTSAWTRDGGEVNSEYSSPTNQLRTALAYMQSRWDERPISHPAGPKNNFRSTIPNFDQKPKENIANLTKTLRLHYMRSQCCQKLPVEDGFLLSRTTERYFQQTRSREGLRTLIPAFFENEDWLYCYLLNQLKPEDGRKIRDSLLAELGQDGSDLNRVIKRIDSAHEALLALAEQNKAIFNLAKRIWSGDRIRISIQDWNVTQPKTMPYVVLIEQVSSSLEEYQQNARDISDYLELNSAEIGFVQFFRKVEPTVVYNYRLELSTLSDIIQKFVYLSLNSIEIQRNTTEFLFGGLNQFHDSLRLINLVSSDFNKTLHIWRAHQQPSRYKCDAGTLDNSYGVDNKGVFEDLLLCLEGRPILEAKLPNFRKSLTELRNELELKLSNYAKSLAELQSDLNYRFALAEKAKRIYYSRERAYFLAEQYQHAYKKLPADKKGENGLLQQEFERLPAKQDIYFFLLYHLTPAEQVALKNAMQTELAKTGSALNLAINEVDYFHVLIEAYLQLGFQEKYRNDIEFRKGFETVWSANMMRDSIHSWNTSLAEETPYIRLEDRALLALHDLLSSIANVSLGFQSNKNSSLPLSLQSSGHESVDLAQAKLHLFETIFFNMTALGSQQPTENEEL